jgi:quinol monooxygenase YgiN
MSDDPQTPTPDGPVVSLVEWPAAGLSIEDARRLASETTEAFRRVPGLVEIRFFGDFESGTHFYFQVWQNREALDAFMASESMFRIRDLAAPYVAGRPSRRLLADYSSRPGSDRQPPTTTDSP